jgi:hypothetical protein
MKVVDNKRSVVVTKVEPILDAEPIKTASQYARQKVVT